MCIYDCYIYIYVCIYIYDIYFGRILPCLVPRFYEVSMNAICGCNRTFLKLLDRVSYGTVGTYIQIIQNSNII